MATAKDYGVTFAYGQWDGVYYTASRPHRGNDRPTPSGTPVVIGTTTIGFTGATGLVSGPHIHTQAGSDIACQKTVNPSPYEFKPGTVVNTGRGSQWGNFVTVKVGNMYITYCHLSKITASVGQQITEGGSVAIIDSGENWYARLNKLHIEVRGRELGRDVFKSYVGKDTLTFIEDVSDDPEADRVQHWQQVGKIAVADRWDLQIYSLQDQLAKVKAALKAEQGKPPKEIIKEVEKIVKVPVEVVKTIEVIKPVDERAVVQGWLARLWSKLFNK